MNMVVNRSSVLVIVPDSSTGRAIDRLNRFRRGQSSNSVEDWNFQVSSTLWSNSVQNCDDEVKLVSDSAVQLYDFEIYCTSTSIFYDWVTMNSHYDPLSLDLIAQLVEHCAECLGIDIWLSHIFSIFNPWWNTRTRFWYITCKILVHHIVSFPWLNIIYWVKHFISWDKTTNLYPWYMTFTYILHLQRVIMNSHSNHSPVGLVAQLVDHGIGIAEVRVWILFRPEDFQVSFLLLR